jgi:hypothetical protein
MTLSPVGLARDAAHRYYLDGTGPIPSVTTIVDVLDKSGPLVGWAKRETAACAVRNLDTLARMVADGGQTAAIEWLKKIPDYQRDSAADLGSRVHALAEATARGDVVETTEEEAPFVASYLRFLDEKAPQYVALEEMVASTSHGYAGTFDAIARIDGARVLCDIKTGKTVADRKGLVYSSIDLQLNAYAFADFIGRPADPARYRLPKVDGLAVIHLRPEGYEYIPFEKSQAAFETFLELLAVHKWLGSREQRESKAA